MAKKRKSETPAVASRATTARVNPALNAPYDDIDLQHAIAQEHWYVCGYKMNMK